MPPAGLATAAFRSTLASDGTFVGRGTIAGRSVNAGRAAKVPRPTAALSPTSPQSRHRRRPQHRLRPCCHRRPRSRRPAAVVESVEADRGAVIGLGTVARRAALVAPRHRRRPRQWRRPWRRAGRPPRDEPLGQGAAAGRGVGQGAAAGTRQRTRLRRRQMASRHRQNDDGTFYLKAFSNYLPRCRSNNVVRFHGNIVEDSGPVNRALERNKPRAKVSDTAPLNVMDTYCHSDLNHFWGQNGARRVLDSRGGAPCSGPLECTCQTAGHLGTRALDRVGVVQVGASTAVRKNVCPREFCELF